MIQIVFPYGPIMAAVFFIPNMGHILLRQISMRSVAERFQLIQYAA